MTLNTKSVNTTTAAVAVFWYGYYSLQCKTASLCFVQVCPSAQASRTAGAVVDGFSYTQNALGTECCSSVSNTKIFIKSQLGLLLC